MLNFIENGNFIEFIRSTEDINYAINSERRGHIRWKVSVSRIFSEEDIR